MTTESVAPAIRPADHDTTLRRLHTGHLSAAELAAYLDTLAEAVQRIDPQAQGQRHGRLTPPR